MFSAIKRFFFRASAESGEPDEEEPRSKQQGKVIASWHETGNFHLAINRGKIDGVRHEDIYHCTHHLDGVSVRDENGRVLKTFYVNDSYVTVATVHEDWAECMPCGDARYRPTGWRDGMLVTFVHGTE